MPGCVGQSSSKEEPFDGLLKALPGSVLPGLCPSGCGSVPRSPLALGRAGAPIHFSWRYPKKVQRCVAQDNDNRHHRDGRGGDVVLQHHAPGCGAAFSVTSCKSVIFSKSSALCVTRGAAWRTAHAAIQASAQEIGLPWCSRSATSRP